MTKEQHQRLEEIRKNTTEDWCAYYSDAEFLLSLVDELEARVKEMEERLK